MIGKIALVGVWFVVNDCSRTRLREGRLGTDVHDTTPTTG